MLQRLALAYAPRDARLPTLGLLALDCRLAGVVRDASEPMLAQIRLAWWRDVLRQSCSEWPEGEPLLVLLKLWDGQTVSLSGLVDGWEEMTGPAPLARSAMVALADARGDAFASLAELVGDVSFAEAAKQMGRYWALADLAGHLSDPGEQDHALELAMSEDQGYVRLPRRLRPLSVLHGMARRRISPGGIGQASPSDMLVAMRIGLLGR